MLLYFSEFFRRGDLMKRKKFLPLILISLIVFPMLIFGLSKSSIVTHYKTMSEVKSKFQDLLYKYDDFDDELPVEDCIYVELEDNISYIDKDLALEDIEYLFSLLKYGYAGYEFFGGDEKFTRARRNMIWSLREKYGEEVPVDRFLEIICTELRFIQDAHFLIEDHKMCDYSKYFSSRKYDFRRDGNGYYTIIDDKKHYLIKVNNESPDSYMKLTLDEDGKLVYNLGILSDTENVCVPLVLLLESENNITKEKISLFEYIPYYKEKNKSYNYYEIDGIPVLEVNSFCRMCPEDESIEEFIRDSRSLRNKENLIIDLRNNTGGSTINIDHWYRGFTGKRLQKDIIESGLYTDTSVTLTRNKFENKENEKEAVIEQCLGVISSYEEKRYFPGWSPIEYNDFKPVENNVNIYILVDKSTASAAEFFAYYLRKLDNVLIVGTNTNGCTLTGNCSTAYLPNSQIKLHLTHKIYMNKDLENTDGIGLLPDLWVKPCMALDRVIKYIKNK